MINIDFRYRSIGIETEKNLTSINIDDFQLLSIPIDCYRFCQSIIIDELFSVTSISIDFRYQSILIGGLNRLRRERHLKPL